jgi:hypothetical protein
MLHGGLLSATGGRRGLTRLLMIRSYILYILHLIDAKEAAPVVLH